mmetsp:Transcript_9745/g.33138  ORF Transcript_9745/g.33138 Transcript_9745/m.33138 type:complete len:360 (-) Transcript_9745:229-1308(-)
MTTIGTRMTPTATTTTTTTTTVTTTSTGTPGDTPSTPVSEVMASTDTWLATVSSHTTDAPRETAALYADDALFWGTVSEDPRTTNHDVLSYFEYFARLRGLRIVEYTPCVRMYNDIGLNAGTYTFQYESDTGTATVSARYSFTYLAEEGSVPYDIIEHHSSVSPTAPAALVASDMAVVDASDEDLETPPPIMSAPMSEEDIISDCYDATQVWIDTVTSGSDTAPEDTTALYSKRALFWGTVSEGLRTTMTDTRAYFEFFARLPNLSVVEYTPVCRAHGHNMAINVGSYTFEYGEEGHKQTVVARYTYMFQLAEDAGEEGGAKWLIVNHHSSVRPIEDPNRPIMPLELAAIDDARSGMHV